MYAQDKNLICVMITRLSHAKLIELKKYRRETIYETLNRVLDVQEAK